MNRLFERLWLRVKPLWQFAERQGLRLAKFSNHYYRVGEIGFGVVLASLCLHWFNPVTTPAFSALNFPVWGPARLWPHLINPMGYAVPAVLLCIVGYIGWRMRKSWMVVGVSWFLLLLGVSFFLQVTCWEPSWLKASIDGGTDFEKFYSFEVGTDIPHGAVGTPAGDLPVPVSGLLSRIGIGMSSLSSGWWFFIGGGILCLVTGLVYCPDWRRLRFITWFCALVTVGAVGIQLSKPIQGEIEVALGVNAANAGDFNRAIKHYRRAIAVDKFNQARPDLYDILGGLYEVTGQKGQPEYHLYLATKFEATDVPRALFELDQAAGPADPALAEVIRKLASRITLSYGRSLYSQGHVGEALKQLELCVRFTPEMAAPYYVAGTICYENADYEAGIEYFLKGLKKTRQPVLLSVFHSGIGDCYYKLGDIETARSYYMDSRKANDFENFRALKSLTGEYYR